jgi:hypothetical protein
LNTAVGTEALCTNTTGGCNTAVGCGALYSNTTASVNTSVGRNSLYSNTTGAANVAMGYSALNGNTTGTDNTALGYQAMDVNTTASNNTAVGRTAMASNTTGDLNTATGSCALKANTTGSQNAAFGTYALDANVSGNCNTAFGFAALGQVTSSNNVAVGDRALDAVTSGSNNIALGSESGAASNWLKWTTESNRLTLGNNNITNSYVKVDWTVGSDVRDKTNFGTIPHGLNFVNQLNPVSFQFKKSREDDTPHGGVRYGFKAQEILALEKANDGTNVIVDDEFEEHLNLTNSHLTPILVKAIKELKAQNDSLKTRIEVLENE